MSPAKIVTLARTFIFALSVGVVNTTVMSSYTENEVRRVAFEAECAIATARKALYEGIDSVRGSFLKERLKNAIRSLKASAKED